MKRYLSDILKFILFTSIGVAILYYFYTNFNEGFQADQLADGLAPDECITLADKIWIDLQSFHWAILLLAGFIFVFSNVLRALRWNQLLQSIGYNPSFSNGFWTISLSYIINLAVPRLGEFTRAGAMARNENIPVETVMGTIVTDRLLDFLCLLLMFFIGLLTEFDTLWTYLKENAKIEIPFQTLFVLGIVAVVGLVMLLFIIRRFNDHKVILKVRDIAGKFLTGIRSVAKVKNIPIFICYSLGIWVCYYLMNFILFMTFEPTKFLSLSNVLLVFLFSALGMIIPAPGGMGSYHALVTAGLMVLGVSEQNGFSFAMISWAVINFGAIVPVGILAMIILPKIKK